MTAAAYSMTGFGEASVNCEDCAVSVSVRSVNHRSIAIKCVMPKEAASLENAIRKAVRKRVRRGSVQVSVKLDLRGAPVAAVDEVLLAAKVAGMRRVAEFCGIDFRPDENTVLGLLGAVSVDRPGIPLERLQGLVAECLEAALDRHGEVRRAEGEGLLADIAGHVRDVSGELDGLAELVPAAAEAARDRFRRRLRNLAGKSAVDPQRIMQELAILTTRCDISEELQRLRAHVDSLRACLESGCEIGRRADFIAQEMNREATTVLSKVQPLGVQGLPVTEAGIRIRASIDKIREQSMNLQ